jgi:hypothetical protein
MKPTVLSHSENDFLFAGVSRPNGRAQRRIGRICWSMKLATEQDLVIVTPPPSLCEKRLPESRYAVLNGAH